MPALQRIAVAGLDVDMNGDKPMLASGPSSAKFEVWVSGEPMSGAKAKVRRRRKEELVEAITKELKARPPTFGDKRVKLSVRFNLPKAGLHETRYKEKKDLDNLLKPVLDALQETIDAQKEHPGLNFISNDEQVFRIEAVKRIVGQTTQAGTKITITEF